VKRRIGEILVAQGAITPDKLAAALDQQVTNGARLGTNIIDLYDTNLDLIAEGLAVQHNMPAALDKHFQQRDFNVAIRLDTEAAKRFQIVPLGIAGDPPVLGVATTDPLTEEAEAVLKQTYDLPVMAGVAAELRVRYHLENIYGIERSNRYRRPRPKVATKPPDGGAERRVYASEITEPVKDPDPTSSDSALGKIAIKKVAIRMTGAVDPSIEVDTPEKCAKALRRSTDRDQIAQIVVGCLHQGFDGALNAGVILIIRQRIAITWHGFARNADVNLEGLGVPLDQGGILKLVYDARKPFFGRSGSGSKLDHQLWDHLRCGRPEEVAAIPIELYDRVGCLLYTQSAQPMSENVRQGISELASGLQAAFRRLVRAAER
jgi:hypothetical protein